MGRTTCYAREKKKPQLRLGLVVDLRQLLAYASWLSFLAYNMKRAINMVGTKKLIEAMQI